MRDKEKKKFHEFFLARINISDEHLEWCAKRGYTPRKGWINEHERT